MLLCYICHTITLLQNAHLYEYTKKTSFQLYFIQTSIRLISLPVSSKGSKSSVPNVRVLL